MGYNNNHAGMHMISYKRYSNYENLNHYDNIDEKILLRTRKQIKKQNIEKERVSETKVNNTNKNKTSKNTSNQSNTKRTPKRVYGNDNVISQEFFKSMDLVSKNLMLIALKQGKDTKSIINEAEELMNQDRRTNAELDIQNPWSWLPIVEKSTIFLSILADKLNCSVQDFFINDEKATKTYIYKLLDEISDYEWNDGFVESDTGNAEIKIESYEQTVAGVNPTADILSTLLCPMDLVLYREYHDGVASYSISYGSLLSSIGFSNNYLIKGAYLWEEEKGKLQKTVERLLSAHPEWIDNEYYNFF